MEIELSYYILFFLATIFSGFYGVIFGGAGFINIPLMLVMLDLGPAEAVATNIFGALALTTIGGYRFFKQGKADLKLAAFLTVFALVGTALGVQIVLGIEEFLLKQIMVVALLVSVTLSFVLSDKSEEPKLRKVTPVFFDRSKRLLVAAFLAFPLGVYQAVVSAGYGTMMTYLPVIIFRKKFKEAIGTARLQGVPMVIFTSLGFAYLGVTNYLVGLILMAGMAIGAWFGAGFAIKINPTVLRTAFALVVGVNVVLLLQ